VLQCVAVCCGVLQVNAVTSRSSVGMCEKIHEDGYTGWRRPIGCLELQVIFRKRATNYRALLRKMTYEDKASHDSTPPCTQIECS